MKLDFTPPVSRRAFLQAGACLAATSGRLLSDEQPAEFPIKLAGEVGVTTSSLSGHLVARPGRGKFSLIELPRIMRDELDMRVIDLNTSSLASQEPAYLDRCREAAEKAACVFTNLKLNQRNLDMNSPDRATREKALAEYRRSIDAAARLGARWARPLPSRKRPDMKIHVASYRALAEHAAGQNVQMLVENFGWMESDPESVPRLVKAIGANVAPCPDTGNWKDNQVRYAGLAKAFVSAVTCDFKARTLGPDGEHKLYDLKRCFEIGWDAGFRGPWCLEHANASRKELFRELAMLRDMLRGWMAARA